MSNQEINVITSVTPEQWAEVDRIKDRWLNEIPIEQVSDDVMIQNARRLFDYMDVQIEDCFCVSTVREANRISAQRALVRDGKPVTDQNIEEVLYDLPKLHKYFTTWLMTWVGWFEGGKALGVQYDEEKYNLLRDVVTSFVAILWDQDAIYLLRKPREIHWQNGLLHNESGPSVKFTDDFCLWTIRGVAVTEQIVMRPETLTIDQILDKELEDNEERRRIMIERYGWKKFLNDVGAKPIDERQNDIEQTIEVLFRCESPNMVVLMAACPSTAKVFFLEVSDTIKTCEEAQAWLHDGSKIDELIGPVRTIGRS
jgi:hypothetical protein